MFPRAGVFLQRTAEGHHGSGESDLGPLCLLDLEVATRWVCWLGCFLLGAVDFLKSA